MNAAELLEIISRAEDGKHQFKENVTNSAALAGEMVAFSNSGGGQISGSPGNLREKSATNDSIGISNRVDSALLCAGEMTGCGEFCWYDTHKRKTVFTCAF